MKTLDLNEFDEKDEDIVNALILLGLSRPVARTLTCLRSTEEATTTEIERIAGLRQPEVSIAARELKELGWISEREEKKPGKGRPHKLYSLKLSFDDIISTFEIHQQEAQNRTRTKIKQLKDLTQG